LEKSDARPYFGTLCCGLFGDSERDEVELREAGDSQRRLKKPGGEGVELDLLNAASRVPLEAEVSLVRRLENIDREKKFFVCEPAMCVTDALFGSGSEPHLN
jgi:hypothetical protein